MRKLIETVLTLGKVLLRSRPVGGRSRSPKGERGGRLVVMGNGPSLRGAIDAHGQLLRECDTMAVNFAANSDDFFSLRPRHYVLADPHFFSGGSDPNLALLWSRLQGVGWPMTLHLPAGARLPVALPHSVEVRRFNMTPGEGWRRAMHLLYRGCMAMPRPRNVLIPALMEGIREGYGEIYVVGADHTWPHTLYVDDSNRVVSVQPHFYKEDPRELDRIARAYAGRRIHDVLGSMAVAFRSYHAIRDYADSLGVRIFNATPGSLIDAFPRRDFGQRQPL